MGASGVRCNSSSILHWFGLQLYPRFTNLQAQLPHLHHELIVSEKGNMDQIVATLGLKEMTQSTLIGKLCTYSQHHRTRRAIFEFDKLIRTLYTLRYLLDPQLQRNVHRSQNRIEAYHQLRSSSRCCLTDIKRRSICSREFLRSLGSTSIFLATMLFAIIKNPIDLETL